MQLHAHRPQRQLFAVAAPTRPGASRARVLLLLGCALALVALSSTLTASLRGVSALPAIPELQQLPPAPLLQQPAREQAQVAAQAASSQGGLAAVPAAAAAALGKRPSPAFLRTHIDRRPARAFAAGDDAEAAERDRELDEPSAVAQGFSAGADAGLPLVLVLTPVKNSQRHLPRFFSLLRNLSYPPSRLALGLLDSDSDDAPDVATVAALLAQGYSADEVTEMSGTLALALAQVPTLEARGWAGATVALHDFGLSLPRQLRHGKEAQLARRSALARSRNHLLTTALREEHDFCLWIDSDLHSYPHDVVQRLLAARRDVIVPNVVMALGKRSYDLNSWRASSAPGDNATVAEVVAFHDRAAARSAGKGVGAGEQLKLEGYGETGNKYLHHLRRPADPSTDAGGEAVVRLDAVGGAMLLVRAELHRHGLVFPPVVYRGRIETEGLSMMAMDMGKLSYGIPSVECIHH